MTEHFRKECVDLNEVASGIDDDKDDKDDDDSDDDDLNKTKAILTIILC